MCRNVCMVCVHPGVGMGGVCNCKVSCISLVRLVWLHLQSIVVDVAISIVHGWHVHLTYVTKLNQS